MQAVSIRNSDYRVLVVDDDDAIRFVACETLQDAGFSVVEASNGQEALQLFSLHKPDLVLLDLVMPTIDGFQVCKRIRGMSGNENLPIMIMTGLDDAESINKAFEAGATDFITKPLNHFILEQRTRYILRASKTLKTLEQREHRLANAERIAHLGSWDWDTHSKRLFVSREFNRILGLTLDAEPSIRDVFERFSDDEQQRMRIHYETAIARQEPSITLEHTFFDNQGDRRRVRHEAEFRYFDANHYAVVGTLQDITEETTNKDRILQLAYYDSLTSLPNRTFFKTHLEYAIRQARPAGAALAVIMLDLDLFTRINNSLGHEAGDKILGRISERLAEAMNDPHCTQLIQSAIDPHSVDEQPRSVLARLEGDQFVILLYNFSKLDDVVMLVQRVFKRLSAPIQAKSSTVVLTASSGIALYPVNGQTTELLMRNADAAMLFAKAQGRNSFRFYSSDIDARSKERLSIENDLRKAIAQGELELHYQPKISLQSREVRSVEALIRWRHPERGMVSPGQFIPMAEELGLINDMGDWIIDQACKDTRHWNQLGIGPVRTAINLSALQLKSSHLVEKIRSSLEKQGLIPAHLEIEITESVLLEDSQRTLRALEGLRSLGLKVALDDFGTGFSSLSYLTRFPFTGLKIDRCFITDCIRNSQSAAIVHTIIQLCKHLSLEVVAEGVEVEEELRFLRDHRCDVIQGFYFSPALDSEAFVQYMRQKPWLDQLDDLD